ncbi:CDP-glycerol glycerophosphotransferase family protein [Allobacillus sp. SKP2-8]|uniref:CDP-glycerol glycerophosphotransferase family protein n=1 Tax=unclassified Allobacillus TaxID=2628859 RepID=UPI0011820C31|nr:CDP-glycerol glycerophosphotransferase family protein [Allobacillus sp. SKP2-8]TSJ62531.1 CDP-glycerol glycerophosphotransferase family protein [Allobacillus sp. SKP2-8]
MTRYLIKLRRGKIGKTLLYFLFKCISLLPRKEKSIVFESFHGKQFSDNPKAIYNYMKENHPEYKLYWSVDRRSLSAFNESDVNILSKFSLKWIYIMGRAKVWVINARLPLWIPKNDKTIYIQTWHGTPLKKLGIDIEDVKMPGTSTEKYRENFSKESSKWDYLISPNRYSTEIFKRAFNFQNTILEVGYPRNDVLTNLNYKEYINKIKSKLNIPLDKKVLLYAPTWRDNNFFEKGKYRFDMTMDLDRMKKKLGQDYVILFRFHYLIADKLDLSSYHEFAYNVSRNVDISDLYLISDILITDYSSVFFDFANLRKPMIFYTYDLEEYRDELRGFYIDFEKQAPGPLVKNTEQLIDAIINIDEPQSNEDFYNYFCYLDDGKASKRVAELIVRETTKT